ncbi:hypothetical protein AB6A40_011752 [Gnathostoma spinigerum]|uniref:Uncharacterized protein n=1 Tax=Gnathostoma spinigerum TaxID=75299 RepID=A0ABD6EYJ6_9BILA
MVDTEICGGVAESWGGGGYGGGGGDRFAEPYAARSGGGPMRRGGWMGDGPVASRGGSRYSSRVFALKMRGLPYRATERDIADVSLL